MPTIQQLVRFERVTNKKKTKSPALKMCPQRRGVVHEFIQLHRKNQIQLYVKWLE